MPIHNGIDEYGYFYQWGGHGKRYYFNPNDINSRDEAYQHAASQARAAYAHGYHKK